VHGVAVAAVSLLLAGCGQNAPGVAAEVGDDTITDTQVDELAEALCVLNAGADQSRPLTSQETRRQALQILLDNELAADIIDPDKVDKEQVAAARQQAAQSAADTLPGRLRGSFDEAVGAFATTQLGLAALGRESLVEQGTKAPDQQAALAEGQRLLVQHANESDVSVDPRFGTLADGQVGPADGSLSVAVSGQAKASAKGGAGADLPANLSCNAG
jgi:hypothetical protein